MWFYHVNFPFNVKTTRYNNLGHWRLIAPIVTMCWHKKHCNPDKIYQSKWCNEFSHLSMLSCYSLVWLDTIYYCRSCATKMFKWIFITHSFWCDMMMRILIGWRRNGMVLNGITINTKYRRQCVSLHLVCYRKIFDRVLHNVCKAMRATAIATPLYRLSIKSTGIVTVYPWVPEWCFEKSTLILCGQFKTKRQLDCAQGYTTGPIKLILDYVLKYITLLYKYIERHTARAIVSWPNPKQWVKVHTFDWLW